MQLKYLFLVLSVVTIWGLNLVIADVGLEHTPPLFLVFIRFFFASVPAIFFVKRPNVSWGLVAAYGLIMFALQFSLLFIGLDLGVTPAIASFLMQSQLFFTVLLGWIFLREKIHKWQAIGGGVAVLGIIYIGLNTKGTITPLGFFLVIAAACAWAVGNLLTKRLQHANFFSLIVWSSFITSPCLLIVSYVVDGPEKIQMALEHINAITIGSVFYLSYLSTLYTYISWSYLLRHYPLATIAPFTLLIPVVALLGSALILGEPLEMWKIGAGAVVLLGLAIDFFGKRLFAPK